MQSSRLTESFSRNILKLDEFGETFTLSLFIVPALLLVDWKVADLQLGLCRGNISTWTQRIPKFYMEFHYRSVMSFLQTVFGHVYVTF